MAIPIKARVQCADGPCGEVTHVIVHPATKKVTRLVVKETKSPHVERLVPLRFVEDTTANEIHLRCSRQELSRMKSFVRTELVKSWSYDGRMPTETKKVKHLNIAEDELVMKAGTQVRATDGKVGRIDELMVDPDGGSLTYLVLREGPVWAPKVVTIPIAEVKQMDEKAVYLRTNRAGIETLPTAPGSRR